MPFRAQLQLRARTALDLRAQQLKKDLVNYYTVYMTSQMAGTTHHCENL